MDTNRLMNFISKLQYKQNIFFLILSLFFFGGTFFLNTHLFLNWLEILRPGKEGWPEATPVLFRLQNLLRIYSITFLFLSIFLRQIILFFNNLIQYPKIEKFFDTKKLFIFLICFSLFFRIFLAFTIPPKEAIDEAGHFHYLKSLIFEKKIPIQQKELDTQFPLNESYHPPLYYLLAAPLGFLGKFLNFEEGNIIILVRFISIILGVSALWIIYRTLRLLLPNDPVSVNIGIILAATLPTFTRIGAGFSNENLVYFLSAILFFLLVQCFIDKPKNIKIILIAIFLSLAMLTKYTSFGFFLTVPLALYLTKNNFRKFFSQIFLIFSIVFLFGIAWFTRNFFIYGDPLALDAGANPTIFGISSLGKILYNFIYMFASFWASFPRNNLSPIFTFQPIFILISIFSAIGLFFFFQKHRNKNNLQNKKLLFFLIVSILIQMCMAWWFGIRYLQGQGRFLFPTLIPILFFFAVGIRESLTHWNINPKLAIMVLTLLFLSIDIVSFFELGIISY